MNTFASLKFRSRAQWLWCGALAALALHLPGSLHSAQAQCSTFDHATGLIQVMLPAGVPPVDSLVRPTSASESDDVLANSGRGSSVDAGIESALNGDLTHAAEIHISTGSNTGSASTSETWFFDVTGVEDLQITGNIAVASTYHANSHVFDADLHITRISDGATIYRRHALLNSAGTQSGDPLGGFAFNGSVAGDFKVAITLSAGTDAPLAAGGLTLKIDAVIGLPGCTADLGGDGNVNVTDLLDLIGDWGPCAECPADLNGDGNVNVTDLLELIGEWGPCCS